jgi:hypothetical protein
MGGRATAGVLVLRGAGVHERRESGGRRKAAAAMATAAARRAALWAGHAIFSRKVSNYSAWLPCPALPPRSPSPTPRFPNRAKQMNSTLSESEYDVHES